MGNIKTYKFVREWREPVDYLKDTKDRRWFIVLPEWTGSRSSLEMVAGADKLLDNLSEGNNEVILNISDETPIDIPSLWNILYLKKKWAAILGGGADYVDKEGNNIWLCNVTKFIFGYFPKYIWYQVAYTPSLSDDKNSQNSARNLSVIDKKHLIVNSQNESIKKHSEVTKQVAIDFIRFWDKNKENHRFHNEHEIYQAFLNQYE